MYTFYTLEPDMKDFFNELLQFNHHFNRKIITVITENPEKVSEKCLKLVSHILNAHHIWNYRILEKQNQYKTWDNHPINELDNLNKRNHEDSTLILDTFDLPQPIQYTTSTGQPFKNTIRDIMFHVINHSTYHRGQIATEFRLNGLEPLLTDYIYYKMTQTIG